jgi:hypothetical protein
VNELDGEVERVCEGLAESQAVEGAVAEDVPLRDSEAVGVAEAVPQLVGELLAVTVHVLDSVDVAEVVVLPDFVDVADAVGVQLDDAVEVPAVAPSSNTLAQFVERKGPASLQLKKPLPANGGPLLAFEEAQLGLSFHRRSVLCWSAPSGPVIFQVMAVLYPVIGVHPMAASVSSNVGNAVDEHALSPLVWNVIAWRCVPWFAIAKGGRSRRSSTKGT